MQILFGLNFIPTNFNNVVTLYFYPGSAFQSVLVPVVQVLWTPVSHVPTCGSMWK